MKTARLNFAEKQFINRRIPGAIMATIGALAILGLLLNIILTLMNGGEYFKQKKILREQSDTKHKLETRLKDAEKELSSKDTPVLTAEALYLKKVLDKKAFSWTDFLSRLEDVKPYGTIISDINPDVLDNGNVLVKVKGLGQPRDEIFKFEQNVFVSKYFSKPHLIKEQVEKQTQWQEFDMNFIYIPEGKE